MGIDDDNGAGTPAGPGGQVRTRHLIPTSRSDNMRDCSIKGRVAGQKRKLVLAIPDRHTPNRDDYVSTDVSRLSGFAAPRKSRSSKRTDDRATMVSELMDFFSKALKNQ